MSQYYVCSGTPGHTILETWKYQISVLYVLSSNVEGADAIFTEEGGECRCTTCPVRGGSRRRGTAYFLGPALVANVSQAPN